jgi:PAS domain S-box-containing protein
LGALILLAGVFTARAVEELRTAQQVRSLTAEQAQQSIPVRLRGVVTFFDEELFSRFIQDDTAGIYLKESTNTPGLIPGQIVEVEGVTSAGEYAPIVVPGKVRVVGQAELPVASPASFELLASGKEDSQFVEAVGIVRAVHSEEPLATRHVIEITTGGGRLKAYSKDLPVSDPGDLVDSTVKVRGVCSTVFNRQRQLFNIRLMVPRPSDLVIEKAAAADPFAIPARNIGSLLQFTPQGTYGHRVKVTGIVTHQQIGAVLFIEDDAKGLYVQTRERTSLRLGDRVEVLGFPAHGDYSPVLEDAIYRKTGSGPEPKPDDITLDEALKGTHDCQLVRMRGKLLDRAAQDQGEFLIVETGGFLFRALLDKKESADAFARVENGSGVSVTGVCLIDPGDWQAGETWRARSFHLVLRTPADLVVLQPPPWWTLQKVLWIAGLLAVLVLATFAWIGVLRRRVQKQTEIIRQKLQAEAALTERYEVLFENANDVVFTLDLNGSITSINNSGERLLQRRRDDLLNENILKVVAEDQRGAVGQWLAEMVQDAEPATAEWDFINADSQRVKLEISTRIIERDGKRVEIEGIARDITERRRLEREILEISNREQRRIGHDLHDGVCQQLAAIAYRLAIAGDRLQQKAPAEAAEVEQIENLINEANSQARSVARGLFPVRLEESGLAAALEELADGLSSRFKVKCRFLCKAPPLAVDNEVALHLYFIAQEALLNALRHGNATDLTISLGPVGDQFALTVQDNGKGFQISGVNRSGMGIRIMRYRARVIGAALELTSQEGRGAKVACVFSPVSRESLRGVKNDGNNQQ